MTDWTHVRVKKGTHEKLGILRDRVMLKDSVDEVIMNLMYARNYDSEFFKRLQEKIPDE